MPDPAQLQALVDAPIEDLGAEYKAWLDLSQNAGRATLAKAGIAMANHGGGFIVLGFDEVADQLQSVARPEGFPDATQDSVNAAIRRYATPEFHCQVHMITDSFSGVVHPVVCVPGGLIEPVMSRRDCDGVISRNRCYIRKPGPRSEEPQTSEEWRILLNRCVRAGRDDMLDAIRSIMSGSVEAPTTAPGVQEVLQRFSAESFQQWSDLASELDAQNPSRFPDGFYEMSFSLIGADEAPSLQTIQERLRHARRVRMTGWGPFLELNRAEWEPYNRDGVIEAWVGRPVEQRTLPPEPAHSDFWRATRDGKLYTIRGYSEDGLDSSPPGQLIDITLPVWRFGEAIHFAARFAESFEDVEAIAIRARFTGLEGRSLTSVTGRRLMFRDRTSQSDEITLETTASLNQLHDNMVEVLHGLLSPLYELFGFFELSERLVEEELARLTEGRY